VLLSGERGTGRDHVARVMHYTGTRAMGPFLKVECAALTESELELELFGREPHGDTNFLVRGVMDEAHDGTLFLNDAGALPPSIQQRLLRYIETGAFRRRGDSPDITVDVRIVAATDRPLEPEVAAGRFRAELFYRMKVLTVETPPLAAHLEDLPVLVRHFLEQRRRAGGHGVTSISDAAVRLLQKYAWPGNMDELRAVIDRAAMLASGREIGAAELVALGPRVASAAAAPAASPTSVSAPPAVRADAGGTFELPEDGCDLAAVEKSLVLQALDRAGGNQTKAAQLLGIHRDHVRYRLRKWREGT
jgi:DNA-binding NtrC family response regulator